MKLLYENYLIIFLFIHLYPGIPLRSISFSKPNGRDRQTSLLNTWRVSFFRTSGWNTLPSPPLLKMQWQNDIVHRVIIQLYILDFRYSIKYILFSPYFITAFSIPNRQTIFPVKSKNFSNPTDVGFSSQHSEHTIRALIFPNKETVFVSGKSLILWNEYVNSIWDVIFVLILL